MTLEEKKQELTKRVKEKLDEINYRIYDIHSYFSEKNLLRDLTERDVIITSFTETTIGSSVYLISDPDTLEMLYVQNGPTNFVDIDEFFKPRD